MRSTWQATLRVLTLVRKEITDVLNQPALVLLLVVGPFLVLLVFGLGYRQDGDVLRTLFVAQRGTIFADEAERYTDSLVGWIEYAGTTADEVDARQRLEDGEVDVIVVFPPDPVETVLGGEPATITVVHNQLDPIIDSLMDVIAAVAVDQVNASVLEGVVGQGQDAAEPVDERLAAMDATATDLDVAVAAGDEAGATSALDDLDLQVAEATAATGMASLVLDELGDTTRRSEDDAADPTIEEDPVGSLSALQAAVDDAQASVDDGLDPADQPVIDALHAELDATAGRASALLEIDPSILVRPLRAEIAATTEIDDVIDFYGPSTVVLLMQHFAVAFAGLAIVRDRQLGITELFDVSPIGVGGLLVSKIVAYLVLGAATGAALVVLVVTALDVPIAGSVWWLVPLLGLVLVASIGIGLVLSLLARSDGQAVQVAMLVLLASLFFSGFFLSADRLVGPAVVVTWVLPVTWGIRGLQDVMLLGREPEPIVFAALGAIAAVALVLARLLATRRIHSRIGG
ncbi:MAG: ABC transporter permease [Actinomycetota bacterium]|nr:ABC transporter permease [Actinomycetota bacterium]